MTWKCTTCGVTIEGDPAVAGAHRCDPAHVLIALVSAFFDRTLPAMSDPAVTYVIRYSVGTGECSVVEERKT